MTSQSSSQITLGMDLVEARALWHSVCTTVDLMDQVGTVPPDAPLYGQRDRLVALAQRLDHEINQRSITRFGRNVDRAVRKRGAR